jgi:hypothetical protein
MFLQPEAVKATSPTPWVLYVITPIFAVACLLILATA